MENAKKRFGVLVCLVALSFGIGMVSNADAAPSVAGTYQIRFETKVWLQGEGTDFNTTFGTVVITDDKKWQLNEEGRKYSGKWKLSSGKIQVKKTKSLRTKVQNKSLKPWLVNYVKSEGSSISNIQFNYSNYKITNITIEASQPVGSFKIILKGKVSGNVSGLGYQVRAFKYESKVTFL